MDRSMHEKRGDHPGPPVFPAGLGGRHWARQHGAVMSQQSIVIFPRRQSIPDNVRLGIEARAYDYVQPDTPLYGFRRGDYLQLELACFF
jgi:hypothetical protein